jgi:hypothetical protein
MVSSNAYRSKEDEDIDADMTNLLQNLLPPTLDDSSNQEAEEPNEKPITKQSIPIPSLDTPKSPTFTRSMMDENASKPNRILPIVGGSTSKPLNCNAAAWFPASKKSPQAQKSSTIGTYWNGIPSQAQDIRETQLWTPTAQATNVHTSHYSNSTLVPPVYLNSTWNGGVSPSSSWQSQNSWSFQNFSTNAMMNQSLIQRSSTSFNSLGQ